MPAEVPSVTLEEAHLIAGAMDGRDYSAEPDLDPEEERLLCRHSLRDWGSEFVFVTHFPTAKRPFYTMDDPAVPGTTRSFDLLFRGLEITTGGQRIHDHGMQVDKMRAFGVDPENFAATCRPTCTGFRRTEGWPSGWKGSPQDFSGWRTSVTPPCSPGM
jgi:nondiscriminating aspartyl-tRNA synthetase